MTNISADLIVHRATEVLSRAKFLPAHRRDIHPARQAAAKLLHMLHHPQGLLLLMNHSYLGTMKTFDEPRPLLIHGFSAGSLNGLAVHRIALDLAPTFSGNTVVGAIACPVFLLSSHTRSGARTMQLIHYEGDLLCVWHPSPEDFRWLQQHRIKATWIAQRCEEAKEVDWLGKGHHGYGHLPSCAIGAGTTTWLDLERANPTVTPRAMYT